MRCEWCRALRCYPGEAFLAVRAHEVCDGTHCIGGALPGSIDHALRVIHGGNCVLPVPCPYETLSMPYMQRRIARLEGGQHNGLFIAPLKPKTEGSWTNDTIPLIARAVQLCG